MKAILKFAGFGLVLVVLWLAYNFFLTQTLLSSGRDDANSVIEEIEGGEQDQVKAQLDEFVGDAEQAQDDESYVLAVSSLDFVASAVEAGAELEFVDGQLSRNDSDQTLYSAVYELPAEQGGEDYFVVVLRRAGGSWQLVNVYLAAVNPLD